MKLIAKNAEDRYQSAFGLKHDLGQVLAAAEDPGGFQNPRGLDFALGRHDVSDRFQIPQKLYGREKEIKTLLTGFERTSRGKAELMLVTGFAGVGKSALVSEVHKPIT